MHYPSKLSSPVGALVAGLAPVVGEVVVGLLLAPAAEILLAQFEEVPWSANVMQK